jgi:mannitol-specific phosphotransferase system IIBC component
MESLIYMAASIISFIIAAYILDRDDEEQDRELEETMKK